MHQVHGYSVPSAETVTDLESLVGYLATQVSVWHECIYCGATKHSTSSVQSHMRDKGHCQLNLEREPELLDFWEEPDPSSAGEESVDFSYGGEPSTAERLATNRTITPAIEPTRRRQNPLSRPRDPPPVTQATNTPSANPESRIVTKRQLARVDMAIMGLSAQQHQSLVLAEKKAQRGEAVARRAREWVYAKGANAQKYDQLDGKMKFGKQNHKLMPR